MTTPKETIWEIEPHTLAKHEILRRYLGAWFPILGTHNPRIVYIDGFCGPGRYKGGEIGSPIIALREALKHADRIDNTEVRFLFMDERADRIAHLKAELEGIRIVDNFHVDAQTGLFADGLAQLLDALRARGTQLAPTFAFIDPFGFKGVPFDLVRRLLRNDKTEVLINIMADSVNRFLEHPDSQTQGHIIELFGTPDVLNVAQQGGNRITELRLLYQKQLSKHARFVRYFEMRDQNHRAIYFLFFASNHPRGHTKMKEAFWKVDPESGFCFSDATNPDQLVLFEVDETPKLMGDLVRRFGKRRVEVREVQMYVEELTPFVASHMREALRRLEDQKAIVVEEYKLDGKKRRRNTFPEEAVLRFSAELSF